MGDIFRNAQSLKKVRPGQLLPQIRATALTFDIAPLHGFAYAAWADAIHTNTLPAPRGLEPLPFSN